MKSTLVDTVTSNDEAVRLRIFEGVIPMDQAGLELLELEQTQHAAARSQIRLLRKEITDLKARIDQKSDAIESVCVRLVEAETKAAKLSGELDVVNEAFEAAASRLANEQARSADLARALDLALDSDRQADLSTAIAIRSHWSRPEAMP